SMPLPWYAIPPLLIEHRTEKLFLRNFIDDPRNEIPRRHATPPRLLRDNRETHAMDSDFNFRRRNLALLPRRRRRQDIILRTHLDAVLPAYQLDRTDAAPHDFGDLGRRHGLGMQPDRADGVRGVAEGAHSTAGPDIDWITTP